MNRPNLQSAEIIAIAVLGWGCQPKSWGRGSRRGLVMVPFERAFVTFPLSLRVSEILSLLCSSTPLIIKCQSTVVRMTRSATSTVILKVLLIIIFVWFYREMHYSAVAALAIGKLPFSFGPYLRPYEAIT